MSSSIILEHLATVIYLLLRYFRKLASLNIFGEINFKKYLVHIHCTIISLRLSMSTIFMQSDKTYLSQGSYATSFFSNLNHCPYFNWPLGNCLNVKFLSNSFFQNGVDFSKFSKLLLHITIQPRYNYPLKIMEVRKNWTMDIIIYNLLTILEVNWNV